MDLPKVRGQEIPVNEQAGSTALKLRVLGFKVLIVAPVIAGLTWHVVQQSSDYLNQDLLFWVAVIAIVELLPVAAWRGLQLSFTPPVLLAVAMAYSPAVAATVAFVGSFDMREFRREIPLINTLFNRSQIALSVFCGSVVFHSLTRLRLSTPWYVLAGAGMITTAVDYAVNVTLVTAHVRLASGTPVKTIVRELRLGSPLNFLLNYLGLRFVGVIIAVLFLKVQIWAIGAFILPLLFARQMFFRTLALEEASEELKDREQVLRALSNRMAEERQDERMQIAGYLHDDLAQMLFRLTLQAEMAKKRLAQGDVTAVSRDLDNILDTKQQTSDAIRALIRDLHRSPMGRSGLAEAISSFCEDVSRGHPTTIVTDVIEVALPPPIQLLIYQIVREAAMNALKHAEANHIWVSLQEIADGVQLLIRDDGKGFDTSAPPPEGHFGSVMMRERALVAGGTYSISSEVGVGTTITATFPRVWVEEGTALEAQTASQAAQDNAPSHDSSSGEASQEAPAASAEGPSPAPPPDQAPPRDQPREPEQQPAGARHFEPNAGAPEASANDVQPETADRRPGWRRARPAIPA